MKRHTFTKALLLILAMGMILSGASCAAAPTEQSHPNLTASSLPSASEVSETESSAEESSLPEDDSAEEESIDTEEPEQDLHSDFVVIVKADDIPSYMKNNRKLYADLLENILKLYFSGIVSGRINSDSYQHRYSADVLPRENSTPEERRSAADLCTVGGALEYYGCDQKNYMKYYEMYNGTLPYFSCDDDANLYLDPEISSDTTFQMNGFNQRLYHIFKYSQLSSVERDAMTFVADEVSTIVKTYYQGLASGEIHEKNYRPKYSGDTVPARDAEPSQRQAIADQATIGGAVDYAGYYTPYHGCINSLGYNKKSDIFTLPDFTNPDIISIESIHTKISSLRAL